MIVAADGGYSLRCTECDRCVELTEKEIRNAFLRTLRVERMQKTHAGCGVPGSRQTSKMNRAATMKEG